MRKYDEGMNVAGDYIIISRKIMEWEWYKDLNTKVLFLHMLIKANWKEGRFRGIDVPRGAFVSSLAILSLETGLTINEVRTAISHLKSTGEITSSSHNKYTVFTIKNYCQYQCIHTQEHTETTGSSQSVHKQSTSNPQAINKQLTTIEEGNKEIREEPEEREERNNKDYRNYQEIITLYNSLCKSYPRVTKLSNKRTAALRARLNSGYTVDDFRQLFDIAERSDFLKGKNRKNWAATFDWLICDANMAKVLDGNYNNDRFVSRNESVNVVVDKQRQSREMMYDWAMEGEEQ